jgi:hypothetical protein
MLEQRLREAVGSRNWPLVGEIAKDSPVNGTSATIVSFRQACVEWGGGTANVTEFIGMQARASHGWAEAARGGCGVVASR